MSKTIPLVFEFPNYRNFMFGSTLSDIGNQMQLVAVTWHVYQLTHNPTSLGIIGLFTFTPILIFSLFGGLVTDKVDRKKILIISQLISGMTAALLFFMTTTNQLNVWTIYGLIALNSAATCFFQPAQNAIVPHLVPPEHFSKAISFKSFCFQISDLISPLLAGVLIAVFSVSAVYLFNTLSFLPFIISILFTHIPANSNKDAISYSFKSIWEGIHFVTTTPILLSTTLLDFVATFLGTAKILMPIFATDIFQLGPQGLGLLYAAPSIGGIIAGLILSLIHTLRNQGKIIICSTLIYGVATIAFGLSNSFILSLLLLAVLGFGQMCSGVIRETIRQQITPNYLRGRMLATVRIFQRGGPQLGDVEAGFLAAIIGTPIAVAIGGLGTIFATILIAKKFPALLNYDNKDKL